MNSLIIIRSLRFNQENFARPAGYDPGNGVALMERKFEMRPHLRNLSSPPFENAPAANKTRLNS